jgi:hypothetical protein
MLWEIICDTASETFSICGHSYKSASFHVYYLHFPLKMVWIWPGLNLFCVSAGGRILLEIVKLVLNHTT